MGEGRKGGEPRPTVGLQRMADENKKRDRRRAREGREREGRHYITISHRLTKYAPLPFLPALLGTNLALFTYLPRADGGGRWGPEGPKRGESGERRGGDQSSGGPTQPETTGRIRNCQSSVE